MQNFTDENGSRISQITWFIAISAMTETKILENGVNESSLGKSDVINSTWGFIECPINLDPKIAINGTLILKDEFLLEISKESIDCIVVDTKNSTIISVENDDAIGSYEKARVNHGLVKTLSLKAFDQMHVPIVSSLFATIEIPF